MNSNNVHPMDSPAHCGQSQSLEDVRVQVNKDDLTLAQEMVANGDYHQSNWLTNSNLASCPDKPRTRPVPPAKLFHLSPKKPQLRPVPPKLPPKPPHLLHQRSPSSEALFIRRNLEDRDTVRKAQRSQSVSVVTSLKREESPESPERKLYKRPVPTPRKSLSNIYTDGISPVIDMENTNQTSDIDHDIRLTDPNLTDPLHKVSGSKPLSSRGEVLIRDLQSTERSDVIHGSSHTDSRQGNINLNVEVRANVTKSPKKKATNARHVKVRERAAIFEKLIEEETRTRDSQISEPRSRTSSRSSECSDVALKFIDNSDLSWKYHSRMNPYINMPDGLLLKRYPLEDDMVSVSSLSSDCIFGSPQSSIRVPPIHSPTSILSEDDDPKEKISPGESHYTDTSASPETVSPKVP